MKRFFQNRFQRLVISMHIDLSTIDPKVPFVTGSRYSKTFFLYLCPEFFLWTHFTGGVGHWLKIIRIIWLQEGSSYATLECIYLRRDRSGMVKVGQAGRTRDELFRREEG